MVFESNKPDKECSHCGKIVKNMTHHYIKNHPQIVAKIEDTPITQTEITSPKSTNPPISANHSNEYRGNFREILNEKLDQMLSIKVIQMLEKGATIQDVQNLINPPQKGINLEDLKTYKELFVQNTQPQINIPQSDSGEWLSLVNNALPIVGELMKHKKTEGVKDDAEFRKPKEGDIVNSGTIQPQVTTDTKQPSSVSTKSGIIIPTAE